MIKNILICLDNSSYSEAVTDYGIWLGKGFSAKLIGIHVVDIVAIEGPFLHDISGSVGFEPFLNFSTKMREALETSGREILDGFKKTAEERGVDSETTLSYGVVAREICDKAKTADIVVLGRRGMNARFGYGILGSSTEGVIRKSSKPVFMTPETFRKPSNMLLCYDGSPNAAKAMRSAAEFSKTFSIPLTVLGVSKDKSAINALKEAEDYLKPCAIDANFTYIDDEPLIGMKRYYLNNPHDLVFMGVTHHSRIVEAVLGSATEHMMRIVESPLFLEK